MANIELLCIANPKIFHIFDWIVALLHHYYYYLLFIINNLINY